MKSILWLIALLIIMEIIVYKDNRKVETYVKTKPMSMQEEKIYNIKKFLQTKNNEHKFTKKKNDLNPVFDSEFKHIVLDYTKSMVGEDNHAYNIIYKLVTENTGGTINSDNLDQILDELYIQLAFISSIEK